MWETSVKQFGQEQGASKEARRQVETRVTRRETSRETAVKSSGREYPLKQRDNCRSIRPSTRDWRPWETSGRQMADMCTITQQAQCGRNANPGTNVKSSSPVAHPFQSDNKNPSQVNLLAEKTHRFCQIFHMHLYLGYLHAIQVISGNPRTTCRGSQTE